MRLIVRACGERTAQECIRRASEIGDVDVIENVYPFREVLRQTLELGATYNQPWVPVIDADVLLWPGRIERALETLRGKESKVFCLDGKTKDKLLCTTRRAGIHIFNKDMVQDALQYVRDSIKPETRVRQAMDKVGGKTHVGDVVFGKHDYEQYYRDIYRKAYIQTKKLGGKIRDFNVNKKWKRLAKTDKDYRIVLRAREDAAQKLQDIFFDASIYRDLADKAIADMGMREKPPYEM